MPKQIKKQTEDIEKLLARLSSGQNPKRPLSIDETAEGLTACYLNGLALIEDARLLAANGREPRALSLTILALEELAKIPDLDGLYIDPISRADGTAWADFWKRFSSHKPKQKRIAAYGNIIRESTNLEDVTCENPTPYSSYLSENAYGHLDNVKQRNFYVDFISSQFRCPEANRDTSMALDFLFSFAEERADSFGSWHVSTQRSIDFLAARLKVFSTNAIDLPEIIKSIGSLNDWSSSHLPAESDADLMRLACYCSSASVPDYDSFLPECESFLSKKTTHERMALVGRAVASLKRRMEVAALPKSKHRALLMFKLLMSYSTRHLSDSECKELFGFSPGEDARRHFR
ncbi:MAG: AbiV family abortive infection protein [Thiobacillus sp.]|nr:AbiV family abortive infection protein [Thiobacillus sp.]